MSDEVLAHLALVSEGRPGLFYQLYARANEYAWEAHDVGARKELVVDHADVDSALWLLQQVQAESLARSVDPDGLLPRVLHFLRVCATKHDHQFFEVSRRELAWNQQFRAAIEQLVDQLVLVPVGLRVDDQGQFRQVYFCDPRTFAGADDQKAVIWSEVRKITIEQSWRSAESRKWIAPPMTAQRLADIGTLKKADTTKALPMREASAE